MNVTNLLVLVEKVVPLVAHISLLSSSLAQDSTSVLHIEIIRNKKILVACSPDFRFFTGLSFACYVITFVFFIRKFDWYLGFYLWTWF